MKTNYRQPESTNARIEQAGWFKGTESDWQSLPMEQREEIAFKATGCEVAYPTWDAPVDCCHLGCQIRRGECKPIEMTNSILRYEAESGWLRFINDRKKLAAIFKAARKQAFLTGNYDPWQNGFWSIIVYSGDQA